MKSYKQWVDEYLEEQKKKEGKAFAWAQPSGKRDAKTLADVGKALAKAQHHSRKFWKNNQ